MAPLGYCGKLLFRKENPQGTPSSSQCSLSLTPKLAVSVGSFCGQILRIAIQKHLQSSAGNLRRRKLALRRSWGWR